MQINSWYQDDFDDKTACLEHHLQVRIACTEWVSVFLWIIASLMLSSSNFIVIFKIIKFDFYCIFHTGVCLH